MIPICVACNHRANRLVDIPLVGLNVVARERATAGVRDVRTNQPSTFSETADTDEKLKLHVTWTEQGITARFLPVEIPIPGTNAVELFLDTRDSEEHSRKRAERAEKRGLTIGPPLDPTDLPDLPPPLLEPGQDALFLARSRPQLIPAWLWPAAMAKITLGCLCHATKLALVREETVHAITAYALRMLAFDHLYPPDVWDEEDIRCLPCTPAPTHELAGALDRGQHLFALYQPEHPGQASLAQLVLFGRFLIELQLPGIVISRSYGWMFFARSRRVVHAPLPEIAETSGDIRQLAQRSLF